MRARAIASGFGLATAMLVSVSAAQAQYDGSRWNLPASTGGGRRAIATPTPAPRVVYRQPYYYTDYYYGGGYYGAGYYYQQPYVVRSGTYVLNYNVNVNFGDTQGNQQVFLFPSPQYRNFVPQPVAYTLIPAYALNDGTVLADFGLGLEPVRRFCGDQFVLDGGNPPPAPANGRVINGAAQPAPSQPTQSAQNAQAQRFPTLTTASQAACYTQDRYGRFFAVR